LIYGRSAASIFATPNISIWELFLCAKWQISFVVGVDKTGLSVGEAAEPCVILALVV
jgi:hypothetical protein